MLNSIKKIAAAVIAATMCMAAFTACGAGGNTSSAASTAESSATESSATESTTESTAESTDAGQGTATNTNPIVVVSREDGSGTRGAFTELFGLEEKDGDKKVDMTIQTAQITNSTGVMMTTVSGNENAIGYISLGSLDDSVKALKVDGVEATTDNIKSGTYKIARPFNLATKGEGSDAVKDFLAFIASAEGQTVIANEKYIGVNDGAAAFKSNNAEGKITIAGSSSVSPLIEALKEAYAPLNAKVSIEIQTSDSTTGMNSVADGICEIGMASREVKDSELEKGITPTVIAQDGIAVIVNTNSALSDIKSETVTGIYKGEITTWDKVA